MMGNTFKQAEESISELEYRTIETIESKGQKGKIKKSEQRPTDFGDSIKGPIYVLWESQRGGRKRTERLFEEIMGKTFQI